MASLYIESIYQTHCLLVHVVMSTVSLLVITSITHASSKCMNGGLGGLPISMQKGECDHPIALSATGEREDVSSLEIHGSDVGPLMAP